MLTLGGTARLSSIGAVPFCIHTSSESEFVLLSIFTSTWNCCFCFVLFLVLDVSQSLATNVIEHLFMFICHLYIFLGKVSIYSASFSNWIVFLLIFKFLYISGLSPLSNSWFSNFFLGFLYFLKILLALCLAEPYFSILIKFNLLIFFHGLYFWYWI